MIKSEAKTFTQLLLLNKFKSILKSSSEQIKEDFDKTIPKIDIVCGINKANYDKSIEITKTIGLIISFALLGLAEAQAINFSIGNIPISDRPLEFGVLTVIIIMIAVLIINEINKLIGISKYRNNAMKYIADNEPKLVEYIEDNKIKRKIIGGE